MNFQLKKYLVLIVVAWASIIAGSCFFNIQNIRQQAVQNAINEAITSFNKDTLYRRWVASHGGVYVPVNESSPPNPYLSHIDDRDVTTRLGKKLTLVNPAYMTRQVHELGEKLYTGKGHITSLKPLRPENAPDGWESKALRAFERGEKEATDISEINGQEYLRLMRPFVTEKGCLKCHGQQGYAEGDIRGGISVSIPMAPYYKVAEGP